MSASERLRTLLPPGDRVVPVFRKTGPLVAGADAFTRAEDIEALRNALPEIVAVVEAAEVARKIEATSSYKSIYSAPGEMAAPLRAALAALEEKLKP